MKHLMVASIVLLSGISGEVMAACTTPATQVTGAALATLISGQTVCATRGSDRWQEQHQGGPLSGSLSDYKKGPTDPIDPTETVGTWSVNTTANTVTYTYTGGSSYTYSVYNDGGTYSFCTAPGGAVVVTGAIFQAGASCP